VEASLEFITKHAGWGSDPENEFIKIFYDAVKEVRGSDLPMCADLGGNDGYYFTQHGIPTACLGTVADDSNFHGIDEWLSIKDFDTVKSSLIRFAELCE
jgi:di/tripeptidase